MYRKLLSRNLTPQSMLLVRHTRHGRRPALCDDKESSLSEFFFAIEVDADAFRLQHLIRQYTPDIAKSIVLEQGKTFADAQGDVGRGLQVGHSTSYR